MNEIAKQFDAVIRYAADPDTLKAFHRKLYESPESPLPHLVFADWLEENGHADVAHLVRRTFDHDTDGKVEASSEERSNIAGKPAGMGVFAKPPSEGTVRVSLSFHAPHDTRPFRRNYISYVSKLPEAEAREVLPTLLPDFDGTRQRIRNIL